MFKTRLVSIGVVLVLLIGGSLWLGACAKPAPTAVSPTPATVTKLEFSCALPQTHFRLIVWQRIANQLMARTNGTVEIRFHYLESLLKDAEALEGVSKGTADMAIYWTAYNPARMPLLYLTEQPFLVDQPGVDGLARMKLYEEFPEMRKELEANNVVCITQHGLPPCIIGLNKVVNNLDELLQALKGMKIRSMGPLNQIMQNLGATPVPLSTPDTYTALQRGLVDGFTYMPFNTTADFKWEEVSKCYVVEPGIGIYASGGVYVNKNTWQKLPQGARDTLSELGASATMLEMEQLMITERKALAACAQQQIKLLRLTEQEKKRFFEAAGGSKLWEDAIAKVEAQQLPGRRLLQRYQELAKGLASQGIYTAPWK